MEKFKRIHVNFFILTKKGRGIRHWWCSCWRWQCNTDIYNSDDTIFKSLYRKINIDLFVFKQATLSLQKKLKYLFFFIHTWQQHWGRQRPWLRQHHKAQRRQGILWCDETDVRLVEHSVQALSQLLGGLKEKSMGRIGWVYIERKRSGGGRKCSGI